MYIIVYLFWMFSFIKTQTTSCGSCAVECIKFVKVYATDFNTSELELYANIKNIDMERVYNSQSYNEVTGILQELYKNNNKIATFTNTRLFRNNLSSNGLEIIGKSLTRQDGDHTIGDYPGMIGHLIKFPNLDGYCPAFCDSCSINQCVRTFTIDKLTYSPSGEYFNVETNLIDSILQRTDWNEEVFYLTKQGGSYDQVKLFRELDSGDPTHKSAGRYTRLSQNPPTSGQWQIGDKLTFDDYEAGYCSLTCDGQQVNQIQIMSIDHEPENIGKYFSFNTQDMDKVMGSTTWDQIELTATFLETNTQSLMIFRRNFETGQNGAEIIGLSIGYLKTSPNAGDFNNGIGKYIRLDTENGYCSDFCSACPSSCQRKISIVSVDYASGSIGKYFNAKTEYIDNILGRTNWNLQVFYMTYSKDGSKKRVKLHRNLDNSESVGQYVGSDFLVGSFEIGQTLEFEEFFGGTCEATYCSGNFRNNDQPFCTCQQSYYNLKTQIDCDQCDGNCLNCINTDTTCTECESGKFLDGGVCTPCNGICETCENLSSCQSCSSTNVNRTTNLPNCHCQPGYYDAGDSIMQLSDQTCTICNGICETCQVVSACLSCSTTNTNRSSDLPNCPCQIGYYDAGDGIGQFSDKSCSTCTYYCLSCQYEFTCTECRSDLQNRSLILPYCFCDFGFYQPNGTQDCIPIPILGPVLCEMKNDELLLHQWQSELQGVQNLVDGVITQIAMDFGTVTDYADFKYSNLGETDLTFSFHLKIRTFIHDQVIMQFKEGDDFIFIKLYDDSTSQGLQFGYQKNSSIQQTKILYLHSSIKNDWIKYIFQYKLNGKINVFTRAGDGKLLIKQVLDDSSTNSGDSRIPLVKKVRNINFIGKFDGIFDDFRVYEKILSEEENGCLSNKCQYMCQTCFHEDNQCVTCAPPDRIQPPACICPPGIYANAFNPLCQKVRQNCFQIPENQLLLSSIDYNIINNVQYDSIQSPVSTVPYKFDDTLNQKLETPNSVYYELGEVFTINFWLQYQNYTNTAEKSDPTSKQQSMNIFTAYQEYPSSPDLNTLTISDLSIRIDDFDQILSIGIAYTQIINGESQLVQYSLDKAIQRYQWHHVVFQIDQYTWQIYIDGLLKETWNSVQYIKKEQWTFIWGGLNSSERWTGQNGSQGLKFNGLLDEYMIFDRLLSDSEIKCLGNKCDDYVEKCQYEAQNDGSRGQCLEYPIGELDLTILPQEYTTFHSISPVSQTAYEMDDRDEMLFLQHENDEITIGGEFTIIFWYKILHPEMQSQRFIFIEQNTDILSIYRHQNLRTLIIQNQFMDSQGEIKSQFYYCFDCISYYRWNHVAVVFNQKQWVIYINGKITRYDYETNQAVPVTTFQTQNIKVATTEGDLGFGGQFDEFKIYPRILEYQEIQCLYDNCNQIRCGRDSDSQPATCYQDFRQCTYCAENRIDLFCNCPLITFDIEVPQCFSCYFGCYDCLSANTCEQCVESDPPRDINNFCSCPIGYFSNNPSANVIDEQPYWQCVECDYKCSKCVNRSECQICTQGIARMEPPYCRCEIGFYDDGVNQDCGSCIIDVHPFCKVCEKSEQLGLYCTDCEGQLEFDLQKGVCQCPPGKYNLDLYSTSCFDCINDATCNGGMEIVLASGMWRENINSDQITPCINNPDNCLGGYQQQQCQEGYIGALCESCDLNGDVWIESYGNYEDFKCKRCSNQNNVFQTIVSIGFILVLAVSMLISTLNLIKQKLINRSLKKILKSFLPQNNEYTLYLKILTHYLYVIQVISTFNISFPGQVANTTGNPSKVLGYSLDCFLKTFQDCKRYLVKNTSISCDSEDYLYFSVSFILPLLLVWVLIVPLIFFFFLRKAKYTHRSQNKSINTRNSKKQIYNLNYQDQIIFSQDQNFKEEDSLLIHKQQIRECPYYFKEDDQKENRLQNPIFQQMFGFLYIEYNQNIYFWELVKIVQKMTIVMVLAFYSTETKMKGILIFLILFIYGILLVKFQPYQKKMHTYIDIMSTNVCAVSIILGVFIYQNHYNGWKYFAYVFIVILNGIFISVIFYFLVKSAYHFKKDQIETFAKKNPRLSMVLEIKQQKQLIAQQYWKNIQQRVNLFVLTGLYYTEKFNSKEKRLNIFQQQKVSNSEVEQQIQPLQKLKNRQEYIQKQNFLTDIRVILQQRNVRYPRDNLPLKEKLQFPDQNLLIKQQSMRNRKKQLTKIQNIEQIEKQYTDKIEDLEIFEQRDINDQVKEKIQNMEQSNNNIQNININNNYNINININQENKIIQQETEINLNQGTMSNSSSSRSSIFNMDSNSEIQQKIQKKNIQQRKSIKILTKKK